MSLWNGFWGPSFGAEADASSFHQAAINLFSYPGPINELAELKTSYPDYFRLHPDYAHGYHLLNSFYSNLLAIVYSITTGSLFIGSLFSAFIWATSALILIHTMHLLGVDKPNQFKAMVIYSLLPSSIFLTSVTLREPFQLLLVNLAVYSAIKIHLNKSIKHGFLLLAVIMVMKKFHISLYILGLFILFVLFLLLISQRYQRTSLLKGSLILSLLVSIILFAVPWYVLPKIHSTYPQLALGLPAAIEGYLLGGISFGARTQYIYGLNINGMTDLLLFLPKNFFQYLFEPMPWRVSSLSDVVALLENLLRAGLIWKILTGLRHMRTQKLRLVLFTFFCYLALEGIWSIGTVNWGTSIRHHVPGMGLLIVSAFACSRIKRKNQNSNRSNRYNPGMHSKVPGS
jgi:hypothetical protein